jgi:cyclopropane-fatty-acyl-phospholipid synthase
MPLVDRLARTAFLKALQRITAGSLVLADDTEQVRFGAETDRTPAAQVAIHQPRFFRRAAFGGSLAAAESYLDGDWSSDDLTALFRLVIRNPNAFGAMDQGWLARGVHMAARAAHWLRRNTRRASRSNIEAHYDLGNDFFQLILDETMMYSSGIFPTPTSPLLEASLRKLDRICTHLALGPNDHLLEIGTGWGGLALHAARHYGCRITTTTISREQYDLARERIREARLEDRVSVLFEDYRDLRGTYDKLVSIEMIEAVGHQFFDTFFRQCGKLLKPHGLALLQGIVMNEQAYPQYLRSVDFIQKYVFPGGCLPSIGALHQAAARTTGWRLLHLEDFAAHYAQTLRAWRERFHAALDQVRQLGYSERFVRLWDYYLSYCEAAFEERATGVVQMLWAGPDSRHDLFHSVDTAFTSADRTRPGSESIACRSHVERRSKCASSGGHAS